MRNKAQPKKKRKATQPLERCALAGNYMGRLTSSSKSYGVVVIENDSKRQKIVSQYSPQQGSRQRPLDLKHANYSASDSGIRINACSPGGSEYESHRTTTLEMNGESKDLLFLSPVKSGHGKLKPQTLFLNGYDPVQLAACKKELAGLAQEETTITAQIDSTAYYKRTKTRRPVSQNQIKGQSSANFYQKVVSGLPCSKKTKKFLTALGQHLSQEWLHQLAYSLAPNDYNPQQSANLGCGGALANSEMMIYERLAAFFSTRRHFKNTDVKIDFTYFKGTDLLSKIKYAVNIVDPKSKNQFTIKNEFDPIFLQNASKASDRLQTVTVIDHLNQKKEPMQRVKISL